MKTTLRRFFKDKKILITGHTGFKGSWLTNILLDWDAKVSGIALDSPNLFTLLNIQPQIRNYFEDIRNFNQIKKILAKEKPEIVFHLAAQSLVRESYTNPLYTFETNIIGTANVLQAIKEVGTVKSAIIITSDKVYEYKRDNHFFKEEDKLGGYDPYGGSKAAAEIVINSYIKTLFAPETYKKTHHTLIASARAGNVIGGGDWARDRIIPDIVKSIFETNKPVVIRNPASIRPWQFVIDPLYGYLLLAKKLYEGKKNFSGNWNFGPSEKKNINVETLTQKAIKILNKGSYIIKKDENKPEAKLLKLNSKKARKFLQWRSCFSLSETLQLTFSWYKNFYENGGENIIAFTNQQIKSFFNRL